VKISTSNVQNSTPLLGGNKLVSLIPGRYVINTLTPIKALDFPSTSPIVRKKVKSRRQRRAEIRQSQEKQQQNG
jgi:hypothetical protein